MKDQGKFTLKEKQQLFKAVQEYQREYDVPDSDLEHLIRRRSKIKVNGVITNNPYSDKKYQGFVQYLLEKTNLSRSYSSVYYFLSRYYAAHRTGGKRWSEEEDKELLELVERLGERWREIEIEMCKTDVKKRYEKLRNTRKGNKGPWNQKEQELFRRGLKEISEKYGITSEAFNHWKELSLFIGTRTDTQCRNKWHTERACADFKLQDYKQLLQRMAALYGNQDEDEIEWSKLVCDDWTAVQLKEKWLILKRKVPYKDRYDFIDLIRYCQKNLAALVPE